MSTVTSEVAVRTFTVNTKSGAKSVTSPFTDQEAIQKIAQLKHNNFAKDLVYKYHRGGLSHAQLAWTHVLAVEGEQPKLSTSVGSMSELVKLLKQAQTKLTWPKVRLIANGVEYLLRVAGERSKSPGWVTVSTTSKDYCGKVSPSGEFYPVGNQPGELITALKQFSDNPVAAAKVYAKLTCSCCFCGLALTDDRSTEAGYGPVCAENWNLPWGNGVQGITKEINNTLREMTQPAHIEIVQPIIPTVPYKTIVGDSGPVFYSADKKLFHTESSSIGCPPGKWYKQIVLVSNRTKQEKLFHLTRIEKDNEGDVLFAEYLSENGLELHVYND